MAEAARAAPPPRPRLTRRTLFVLGSMNLIDCINANLLLPYVDRMVSSCLDTTPDDPHVARTVGLLVGLYSLCEVLFSVFWGHLADRFGRRPALLIGLGGSAVAPILFGLSTSLPAAFAARALDGFFCGNIGVTRTYLGEIVDSTNEARGFGLIALCFSIGLFIGPILGGELVFPAEWAPGVFGGTVFERFPYLLPNLVYACLAVTAWVIGALFLEETLPADARRSRAGAALSRRAQAAALLDDEPGGTPASGPWPAEAGPARPVRRCYPRGLLLAMATFCTQTGYIAAWNQLFVLVVSLPRSVRGFGLSPREIGLLQNFAAAGLLLTQFCFYPRVTKRFGFHRCYVAGFLVNMLVTLPFPAYELMADPDAFGVARYAPLALMRFLGAVAFGFCGPTAQVWINRAAHGLDKGAVNGWSNSAGALCRAVFPMVTGALLSLGQQSGLPGGRFICIYANAAAGSLCLAFAWGSQRWPCGGLDARKPQIVQPGPGTSPSAAVEREAAAAGA